MKIFHIFTVTPVVVNSNELPQVQYGDYYVVSESMTAAFVGLSEYGDFISASEFYGAELDFAQRDAGVIIGPERILNQRESLEQHLHWVSVQERYTRLLPSAESAEPRMGSGERVVQ